MSRPRREPPPEALAASRLAAFIDAHKRTEEEWLIFDRHSPGWGTSACGVCGERWPCRPLLELAARWSDDPEYDPGWAPGSA